MPHFRLQAGRRSYKSGPWHDQEITRGLPQSSNSCLASVLLASASRQVRGGRSFRDVFVGDKQKIEMSPILKAPLSGLYLYYQLVILTV